MRSRATSAARLVDSSPSAGELSSARAVALVEAAKAGDAKSFAQLYQAFGPMVHAVVVARVPVDAAEDIMQDVFETALQRIGQLREPAAFPGWLLTIARNRATDWLRRRRPTAELDEQQLAAPARPTAEAEQALAVIRTLPDAYSETLVMRFVEGMTGPEIAARTGLSHGSVRVNLTRGMKLLRAKLALRGHHV